MNTIKKTGIYIVLLLVSISCRDMELLKDRTIYADVSAKYWDPDKQPVDSISWNSAILVGYVHSEGESQVVECGFYYSTEIAFSVQDTLSENVTRVVSEDYEKGKKTFSALLTGLTEQTTYYYVAYVVNIDGLVSYSSKTFPEGNTLSPTINEKFTTAAHYRAPEVKTAEQPIEITHITAIIDNEVLHWGHSEIIENGLYWSKYSDMSQKTKVESITVVTGENGVFRVLLTGLEPLTEYYYQAYAISSLGEGVGEIYNFTTNKTPEFPVLSAVSGVENIDEKSASITFRLDDSKGGPVNEYGYYLNGNKVIVSNSYLAINSTYTVSLINLSPNTEYEIYSYAVNSEGESLKPAVTESFKTGIRGRTDANSTDNNLYFELPGIEVSGKTYRFLDRNLGATKRTNNTGDDIESSGWLFQWGRAADGHQIWTPDASAVHNISNDPTNPDTGRAVNLPFAAGDPRLGKFIANGSKDVKLVYQWVAPTTENLNLWSGPDGGIHNPCPEGFRVPTLAEIKVLGTSGATLLNNYGFPIKVAKSRAASSGAIVDLTGVGSSLIKYWTSTAAIDVTNGYIAPSVLRIHPNTGAITYYTDYNGAGNFVRCISEKTNK